MSDAVAAGDDDKPRRNPGLDLVRALAIVLVIVAHGASLHPQSWSATPLLARMFADISWLAGLIGVELFYCLSGFLIGRLLLSIENHGFSRPAVTTFLSRRWMRTLPCYYVILIVLTLAPVLDPVPRSRIWSYFVMGQNLVSPMPEGGWFGTSWSLVVEEWSYLLLPLLAWTLHKKTSRPTLAAAALMMTAAFAIRLAQIESHAPWDETVRKTFPTRMDAIAYGVFLAALTPYIPRWSKRRWALLAFSAAIITITCISAENPVRMPTVYDRVFLLPILAIGLCALIVAVSDLRFSPNISTPTRFIADISYCLYLVHLPVLYVARQFIDVRFQALFYLGASIALAALMSKMIERPIMALRPSQSGAQDRKEPQLIRL